MNKSEFLKALEKCLKYLPREDREDAIAYYTEYLGDMDISEEDDVTLKLGKPREVAKEILDNCTAKAVEEQKESKSIKGSGKIVWLVILGIASIPVSVPIAAALFAVAVAVLVTVFAVLLSLSLVALSIALAGIAGLVMSFTVPGIASKVVGFGVSLALTGLGVLAVIGMAELFKLVVRLIGKASVRKKKTD